MKGKERTIQELHTKEFGNRKFAKIIDLLIEQGYEVSNIIEFYETYRFDVDGYWFQYQKTWKSTAQSYVDYLLEMLRMKKIMAQTPKITIKL